MIKGIRFYAVVFLSIIILSGIIVNKAVCTYAEKQNLNRTQLYENKKAGYQIKFPKSWDKYYVVNENEDYIEICFIGESKTSKGTDSETEKERGLTMFFIANEKHVQTSAFINGLKVIGVCRGIKYYYFTSTDYPISSLYSAYKDPEIKDEKEKQSAFNDFKKAKEMEKDIVDILKTFKAKRS